VFSNFASKNRAVYEIMWENLVKRGRPQMTIWRMRIACWIPKATSTHSLTICNTYCFSTATMVTIRCFIVTLYVHCLSCFKLRHSISVINQHLLLYKFHIKTIKNTPTCFDLFRSSSGSYVCLPC